ncbi:MAG: UbiA family prenyltransferase [Nanoarchaeota archaeon]|nr:UbiA family prenyltransferase [Nanoarchaeota archaeon]
MRIKKKPQLVKDLLFTSNIRFTFFKNIAQFFVGALFYLLTFKEINLINLFFGALSFLVMYSSIYLFNDLMDLESDRKRKDKKKYKPIARGDLSINSGISLMFILIIIGLVLSFKLNNVFKLFLALSLLGNFLHSSVYTRFKDKSLPYIYLGKGLADFSKPAMGWFSQTISFVNFPIFIAMLLASFQTFGYYYLTKKRLIIKGKKIQVKEYKSALTISLIIITLMLITVVYTSFKFALVVNLVIIIIITILASIMNKKADSFDINNNNKLYAKVVLLSLLITLFIYILGFPENIDANLNKHTEEIRVKINNNSIQEFNNIINWVKNSHIMSGLTESIYNITIIKIE